MSPGAKSASGACFSVVAHLARSLLAGRISHARAIRIIEGARQASDGVRGPRSPTERHDYFKPSDMAECALFRLFGSRIRRNGHRRRRCRAKLFAPRQNGAHIGFLFRPRHFATPYKDFTDVESRRSGTDGRRSRGRNRYSGCRAELLAPHQNRPHVGFLFRLGHLPPPQPGLQYDLTQPTPPFVYSAEGRS